MKRVFGWGVAGIQGKGVEIYFQVDSGGGISGVGVFVFRGGSVLDFGGKFIFGGSSSSIRSSSTTAFLYSHSPSRLHPPIVALLSVSSPCRGGAVRMGDGEEATGECFGELFAETGIGVEVFEVDF